jgi:hypothetical protein
VFVFLFGEEKKSLQWLEKLGHKFANWYYKINNQNHINIYYPNLKNVWKHMVDFVKKGKGTKRDEKG